MGVLREGSILREVGGSKDSVVGIWKVNTRYEGSVCELLVDSFEQVIADSVDDRLYRPLPGPAGVYSILSGR